MVQELKSRSSPTSVKEIRGHKYAVVDRRKEDTGNQNGKQLEVFKGTPENAKVC